MWCCSIWFYPCPLWSLYLNKVEGGYTGFTWSIRRSVCLSICLFAYLWTELYPLCIFCNSCQIHFIFTHLIKHLQKCVTCKLNFSLWLCLVLTWVPIWINSMGNHGAAGVSSKRRHSSCSSFTTTRAIIWLLWWHLSHMNMAGGIW